MLEFIYLQILVMLVIVKLNLDLEYLMLLIYKEKINAELLQILLLGEKPQL